MMSMMSKTSSFLLPSHFGSPFLTTIPDIKYDAKGRQMGFMETEVQRLERLAFMNASKSCNSSPTQSPPPSGVSSPSRKLISEPYGDPIELMANRLAEEFFNSSDEFSSSSDEEFYVLYSTPQSAQRVPSSSSRTSSRKGPSPPTSAPKPRRRRKRSSLFSIPEED